MSDLEILKSSKSTKSNELLEEPLLIESLSRYTLFPIKYHDVWSFFKQQQASLWVAEEIKYNSDVTSWSELNNDERFFIENVLAFFAGADGIVLENLMSNFSKEVQIPEARAFYAVQAYIEQVHSETYSMLIETYIKDEDRKKELFNAIDTIPCVKKKADWARKWMNPNTASFAQRIIAFIIVEGIFFSGAFCSIFWLKHIKKKMINALAPSNEFIARDEGLHARFGVMMYVSHIKNKLSEETIHNIFKEAVEIEIEFIIESLPCRLIGMNNDLMTKYIKYVADYWLQKLKLNKIYNEENPFDFMIPNDLDGKTNFFEKGVSEYQDSHILSSESSRKFTISDDF